MAVEKQTGSGNHLVGSVDLFVDRDKDDLDPWNDDLMIRLSFSATR